MRSWPGIALALALALAAPACQGAGPGGDVSNLTPTTLASFSHALPATVGVGATDVFTAEVEDRNGEGDIAAVRILAAVGPAFDVWHNVTVAERGTLSEPTTFTAGWKVWDPVPGDGRLNVRHQLQYTAAGSYEWAFLVKDEQGWQGGAGSIAVEVVSGIFAQAGADQVVPAAANVTLDGSASANPDGQPLAYTWQQVAGPQVTLHAAATTAPNFTAPAGPAALRFKLTVTAGLANSTDFVAISVPASANLSAPAGGNVSLVMPPGGIVDSVELNLGPGGGVNITVTSYAEPPAGYPAPPASAAPGIFLHVNVTTWGGATVTEATIRFSLPQSWFSARSCPAVTCRVDLAHFAAGAWTALPTTRLGLPADEVVAYQATTTSFSPFVPVGVAPTAPGGGGGGGGVSAGNAGEGTNAGAAVGGDAGSGDSPGSAGVDGGSPAGSEQDAFKPNVVALGPAHSGFDLSGRLQVHVRPLGTSMRWEGRAEALGYQVWRSNSPYVLLANISASSTSYFDPDAPPGSTYKVTYYTGYTLAEGFAADAGQVHELAGWNPDVSATVPAAGTGLLVHLALAATTLLAVLWLRSRARPPGK